MNIEGQTLFALTVTAHMLSVSGADDTRCLLTTLQAPTDTGTGAPGPAWPVTQDRKARGVRSGQSRPEHPVITWTSVLLPECKEQEHEQ